MQPLIALAFLMTLLAIPLVVFLPVFARDVFRGGAGTYTLLLSISGAGSIVGALVVAAMGNMRHQGRTALMMLVALGACIVGFALSRSLLLSCALLFTAGIALISVFSLVTSLVQLLTSDEMRGRVMSVYNVAFRGGMPIGSLVTGYSDPHLLGLRGARLQWLAAGRAGPVLPVHAPPRGIPIELNL